MIGCFVDVAFGSKPLAFDADPKFLDSFTGDLSSKPSDNVSKIVDDRLEQAFLNDLLKSIEQMDDNNPIPDVNEKLQDYLKQKFNQHSVEAR